MPKEAVRKSEPRVEASGKADAERVQEHGVDGLGLRECPSCGGRMLENRKLRKRLCMDEKCGYQEPIR